jgi:hypothetical protein
MHRLAAALVVLVLAAPGFRAAAAESEVVAVVACDPYGDLKKQLRWVGGLVDQPTLDGFAESFIMMATQFKGLAGLDVGRPAGLVVTAAGDEPAVHAYVPVKDLGKLLDALVGLTGPVEEAGGIRRISPPGGMPLDIAEKNGWAIIGPRGSAPAIADPASLFGPIVEAFTVGVQAFPSRMPEGMRRQVMARIAEAQAAAAAAQGAPLEGPQGPTLVEYLMGPESLLIGAAVDMDQERVFVETQSRMPPESPAAAMFTDAANGAVTVATPATADGKRPALALHLAMPVPQAMRQGAIDGLSTITAQQGSDAGTETAVAILKEALAAMIDAGGYDAAVSVDTSAVADDAQQPVPAVTAGMRVKDGAALEARIKKLVAAAGDVPGMAVAFDSGKAAGANLHTVKLDGLGLSGGDDDDALAITLAVSPTYAWVLAGGNVPARLAAVAGASGKPDPNVKPMADLSLALGPLLRYAAAVARAGDDVASDPAGLEAAAAFADEQASSLVQLLARPIQRGMSLRLSADSGAIRTVALQMKPQPAPPGVRGPGLAPRPLSPALAP